MVKAKKLAKKAEKTTSPYKRGDKVGVYGESGWATTGEVKYINGSVVKVYIGGSVDLTFQRTTLRGVDPKGEQVSLDVHAFDKPASEKPVRAEPKSIPISDAQQLKDQAEQAHRRVYILWVWDKYLNPGQVRMGEDELNGLDRLLKDLEIKIPGDLLGLLGCKSGVERADEDEDEERARIEVEEDDFAPTHERGDEDHARPMDDGAEHDDD